MLPDKKTKDGSFIKILGHVDKSLLCKIYMFLYVCVCPYICIHTHKYIDTRVCIIYKRYRSAL